jgi:hypothetical protein
MLFVLLALRGGTAVAQYYEDEPRPYTPSIARYISAGFSSREFSPRTGNDAPDSLKINYTRIMPLVGFRQGPVEILLGYTNYHLAAASCAAVFFGATFVSEVPLTGGKEAALVLPVVVSADFTKSESAGSDRDHFNVGSLGVGTGLKFRLAQPGFEFSVQAAGIVHYSFEGFNAQSGSSSALTGDAVALLRSVPILDGLVAGYRFRLQSWSMTGGKFEYRTVNHGVYLGVMF